ncbi:MAG: hypothetical protein Ta2E_12060 [Mycoplasmoidaceae bacterium]|nr:MAG: hypothetical protein Ta2E_12060 [Mycoplasmoidaceae bacterium]
MYRCIVGSFQIWMKTKDSIYNLMKLKRNLGNLEEEEKNLEIDKNLNFNQHSLLMDELGDDEQKMEEELQNNLRLDAAEETLCKSSDIFNSDLI